jgi:hypothetical protein
LQGSSLAIGSKAPHSWRIEAKRFLEGWHHLPAERVPDSHWANCFKRSYRPWEAARYVAELAAGGRLCEHHNER